MLGTTSLDEADVGSKYSLASPSCAPAAVLPYKALHLLCFEKKPAAKNSVCLIPIHLVSLDLSSSQLTPHIYRLGHLEKADAESFFDATASQLVESICFVNRAGDMPYVPIHWRHRLSRFFALRYQTGVGRS